MMTHAPGPGPTPGPDSAPWWWQLEDEAGERIDQDPRQEFPSRADAESWLGEAFADLADDGVAAVRLFEGEREVFGPMSLSEG